MSETDFLKLKKHDNVETNTDKFDIENYLNGNWDKIDKNVGEVNTDILNINSKNKEQDTNIGQLQENTETSSNKIAKLETELKEAQEDFYQNSIRGQASGEYIHVEDSSNCRARIGIGGNNEQKMREGYQLLNLQPGMQNGITYYVDDEGYFCISGTCTSDRITLKLNEMVLNGTYTFTNKSISGGGINCALKDNTSEYKTIFWANNNNNTKEVNVISKDLVCCLTNGATYNSKIKLMLVSGSQEKDIEQYGASPSPGYQSKIETVGSNVNLLENTLKSQIINGIDVKVQDNGEIVLNGTATDNFALVIGKINKIKNMTFGGMCDGYGYSKMIAQIQGTDYNVNVVNSNKVALSDLDTEATVRLYIYKGAIIINAIIKPKIVEGTEVGEYSKFGQGCVKVTKCNTNLYDGKNEVGGINNDGSLSSTTDRWRTINYINVKSLKNLIIRVYDIETSGALGRYCLYDDKYNFLSSAQILNTKTDLKVDNASYLKFWFLNEKVASSAQVQVQVEEGTTAKEYNKHEEQSYIMPTQAEMLEGDTFDYDNEEEVHIWKKLILTGNEVFTKGYDKERVSGFYTSIDELKNIDKKRNDTLSDFLCNCLIEKKFYTNNISDEVWGNVNTFAFSTASQHILALNIENISTVDELKAYLKAQYDAGTPVVVYYKLATPTRLAFTDEQKAVAKELNNARTYKNVTNITTDSKAILSLDYAKDQETQNQKMQNEIDEIKQLLSTTQTSALLLDNMQTDIESEVK